MSNSVEDVSVHAIFQTFVSDTSYAELAPTAQSHFPKIIISKSPRDSCSKEIQAIKREVFSVLVRQYEVTRAWHERWEGGKDTERQLFLSSNDIIGETGCGGQPTREW